MPTDLMRGEPVYLIRQHFGDFDQFCEDAVKWDLEFLQIERGAFDGEMLVAGTNQFQFARARLGRRLVQKGTSPPGMRTFGLLADQNIRIFWRGRQVTGDDLFVFPVGGELDSVTQSDFDVFTLSFSGGTLAAASQTLELPDLDKLLNGKELFRIYPQDMAQLRRFLLITSERLANNAGSVTASALESVAEELSRLLISALLRAWDAAEPRRFTRRAKALRVVEGYLADNVAQPPRLGDLCRVANVSERTLEYAFREHYGLTPKAFINACRLNAARKALLLANPEKTRVSDIALMIGFWHLSQFSADYRALFGESPSATLRRAAI